MNCQSCSSRKIILYCKLPSLLFKRSYRVMLCKDCGVGFTIPRPSLNTNYYNETVRPVTYTEKILGDTTRDFLFSIQVFEKRFGRQPRNLLDVGCGNGVQLLCAQKLGLEVKGIEPSTGMYEHAKENGLDVSNCYLEEFDDYQKFDLILLNSVLEHLPAPIETLNFLHKKLSDHALLVFQQAVFDGLVPRLFRWFWYGWAPTEHYNHYTKNRSPTL